MPLTKERKQQLTGEFGEATPIRDRRKSKLRCSPIVSANDDHLQLHSKDFSSRRGLLAMVSRRRRLLDYVKRINPQLYLDLLRRLEIRK